MEQWDNYIPPLNLWNYNSYWHWAEELIEEENLDLTKEPINNN